MTNTTQRARSSFALSACLSLVLLAPTVAAQTGPTGLGTWIAPEQAAAGQFARADHGDFDGDGVADAVIHRGNKLQVMLAPGLYDHSMFVPGVATSYGVCPGGNTSPRSTLLVSNGLGLEEFALDPLTGDWSSQVIDASWCDVPLIEVRDMGGTVGVLAVMADLRTVRCVYRLNGQWFEQGILVHNEPIRDLAMFEFDGAGQIEIAIASDSALSVYDSLGVLRQKFPVGDATSVAIGRLRLPKSVRDGLAWVVTRTEGVQQLIVLTPSGILPPQHLVTLPLVVDIETGDIDHDGDSDIVLSHTIDHTAVVLLNIGNGWTAVFDTKGTGGSRVLPFGPPGQPAPENHARPSLSDIDGDGDSDLLMPVQSSGEVFYWRSGSVDESIFQPAMDLAVPESTCNLESLGNGDLAMNLRLSVDLPEDTTATHIELVVWRRATPDEPTESVAVDRVLVPLTGSGLQTLTAEVLLPQVPDLVPGTEVRFEGMYFWLQRVVRVYNGEVGHRWPARVFAIETSPSPGNYSWFKSMGGSMMFPIHQSASGATLPDLIGCGSELPRLPDFPGGQVPTWI